MARFSRNANVIRLREEFISCPGCGRDRDRIFRERPHSEMIMNQCLTVEHMVPRSEGGGNGPDNLIIVCHRCNFTRGNQTPWNWHDEEHLIYADGWPVPQRFYGPSGEANRQLWRNRGRMIAALLGHGPVEFEGDYLSRPETGSF